MKYLYLLLVAILPLFSIAQSNYKPGYVVTAQGDTLKGYVNYRAWEKNPEKFEFKTALNSAAQTFSKNTAVAFSVDEQEYYELHTIQATQDYLDVSKAKRQFDTTVLTVTVFLRLITTGDKVSLYEYTDIIKKRFYQSEKENNKPVELIFRNYAEPDQDSVRKFRRYRLQLQQLAFKYHNSDIKLRQAIQNAGYFESELSKVVKAINRKSARDVSKSRFGLDFYAGAGYTTLNHNVINYYNLRQEYTTNKHSGSPRIQAGIDLIVNKATRHMAFRIEAAFFSTRYEATAPVSTLSAGGGKALLSYSHTNFSIEPGLIYNFYNTDNFKIYIHPAAAFNFASFSDFKYAETYADPYYDFTLDEQPLFQNISLTLSGRVGISYKQFDLFAGAYTRQGFTDVVGYSFNVMNYHAGINYHFGR